jgi:GDP-L-fucose synthase
MNLNKKIFFKHSSLMSSHINVGSSQDLTIKELGQIIGEVVGFKGKINFDHTKPDGTLRKFLDSERMRTLGFKPEITLKEGLIKTYKDYLKNYAKF